MEVSPETASWAADEFIDYFSHMGNIEDYMRFVKMQVISGTSRLFSLKDEFFNEDIHPEDMDFRIGIADHEIFHNYLEIITSHAIEASNPGRKVILMVYENNTNKIVGFIRLGSPMMNIAPRNRYFGEVLGAEQMPVFNKHAIMGMIIVPTQPFGYNYLGGKLLALLAVPRKIESSP